MSLWKWNNVSLDIDMGDVEFQEKYEKAFQKMEVSEKELQKDGMLSGITRRYCLLFWDLFDDLFGTGTAKQLFGGKMNTRLCEDCYDSFLAFCKKQTQEINSKRASQFSKYKVKAKR